MQVIWAEILTLEKGQNFHVIMVRADPLILTFHEPLLAKGQGLYYIESLGQPCKIDFETFWSLKLMICR